MAAAGSACLVVGLLTAVYAVAAAPTPPSAFHLRARPTARRAFYCLAGLLVLAVKAPPAWLRARVPFVAVAPWPLALPLLQAVPLAVAPTAEVLLQILFFFVKAGAFVFGSGLAIVPFLREGLLVEHQWLTEREFLDAVAVGLITPGPIVIAAAFVGFLIAGLPGALIGAFGVFLPVYLFVILPGRWFLRWKDAPAVRGFIGGVSAAATGAIVAAALILAQQAIVDLPTALIAVAALGALLATRRWKPPLIAELPEPVVVVAAGVTGLLIHGT